MTKVYDASGKEKGLDNWKSVDILSGACHTGAAIGQCDYIAGQSNNTALTTGAPTANVLRAMPFLAPLRGGTIDRIAFEVTTLLAGNGRIGLYDNLEDLRNVYPGALLADSGDISTATTGIKSATISVALRPGRIYWLALVTSAAPTLRGLAVGGVSGFLGVATAGTTALNMGISVAHTFGALPNPFTAAGAFFTAVPIPVLRYRFSA